MEIVINPAATRVWRNESSLQIGFGGNRVVLENLQPRHEALIDALHSGLTIEQARDYGRHLKLRATETQALIQALKPLFLLQTERNRQTDSRGQTLASEVDSSQMLDTSTFATESPVFQNALGEMNRASHDYEARGETVWLRRGENAVFISTLDATGQIIAEALATAGLGVLVSGDITESRLESTHKKLEALPSRPMLLTLPQLSEQQIGRLDLAILLGQQLIEPQKFAAWINRGAPHLGAVFASAAEELKPLVSHVIIASKTPCWVCLELERCARDAAWPQIASQLLGREKPFDSASARLTMAGQVVSKTLAHIDRRNGFGRETPELLWSFSPECSCRLGAAQT